MAKKGSPSISFASNVLDGDDCLQSVTFTKGAEDLTYICNGYMKHEPGAKSIQLSFSVALDNNDTTLLSNFAVGATGAAEYHPHGDTAGNIEHVATNATIISYTENGGPNNIVIADIVMQWDDCTTGAAAS